MTNVKCFECGKSNIEETCYHTFEILTKENGRKFLSEIMGSIVHSPRNADRAAKGELIAVCEACYEIEYTGGSDV